MKVMDIITKAFWKGEFGVTGQVRDEEQVYKVKLEIKGSHVNSSSCSCTKDHLYGGVGGLCPHQQAVLSAYREQENTGNSTSVTTSSQVRTMVRDYTNREVAEIVQDGEELVSLVPRLLLDRQDVRAEFKVGRDRYYVLKDLVTFVRAVNHGSLVEYGKSLAFHHHTEIFMPECRSIVDLVVELVDTYEEHYQQLQRSSYTTIPSLRELNLGKAVRDRFLQLLSGRRIEVEDWRGYKRQVLLREENPKPTVLVRKFGKDGIKVSVPKALSSFMGERYLYILDEQCLYRCDESCSQALQVFFEQMTQGFSAPYEVHVSKNDIPLFYQRVLRKLEPYGVLDVKGVELERYSPQELKACFTFESREAREIVMKPSLRYGEHVFHPVEDEYLPKTVCRDVPGEFRISQVITKYFKYRDPESHDLIIKDDDDAVYQLLSRGMEEFGSLGDIVLADSIKHVAVLPPPKISIGVRALDHWLELTIDTEDMSVADLQKILSAYRKKKPYYRLKKGGFLELDDAGLMTVARLAEGLALTKEDIQHKKIMLPRYRALYMDALLKESGIATCYRDHLFKGIVRGMKSVEDSDYEIPKSLQPILRGYQRIGFWWLRTLDTYGFGGILADDMGLGKTIQVISLLLDELNAWNGDKQTKRQTSLIICPASLVYNWECELQTFAPSLAVQTITGTGPEREEYVRHIQEYDVVITSYDLLKRDILLYQSKHFRFQIIDEAQCIKNPVTQSAKAVKAIDAETKFALTGTPIENRLSELWSIFDYLMPGFLYTYQKFKTVFEQPIVKEQTEDKIKDLHKMIGPFILRRLKQDVLKELPDKLETIIYSRFDQEQKELYMANALRLKQELETQSGEAYGSGKIQVLAELTRLRQICCDPRLAYEDYRGGSAKLDTCMELLVNGVAGGHKILLFSQFTSMLELIGKRLDKAKIPYYTLTGSASKEERFRTVHLFQKDDTPVYLISLKAGGTGLNLTAADMVIHFDPWWNVAAQNQATDRTHRIGQEKQVSVFKLITKDTIEESMLKLQESKKHLAEQIITEGTISLSSLTKEDLINILS